MVVFIGISLFVNIIGVGYGWLGPLFLFGMGIILYQRLHRWIGIAVIALALIAFFHTLHIDIAGILIGALLLYIGYRLVVHGELSLPRSRSDKPFSTEERGMPDVEPELSGESPRLSSVFVGDWRYIDHPYEWKDVNLSCGIGDLKMDLSKAIIPEGESAVVISGLVGDVDLYIPHDLDVSVAVTVIAGDINVLGQRQSGVRRRLTLTTDGYEQARRRVKISISFFIGDIDVRML
jgi:lia operon protein LiaF